MGGQAAVEPASGTADVILTANGPGEVAGWLGPVARALRCRVQAGSLPVRLYVWVPPCNFASGHELEMVRAMGPFDGVFDPPAMWRFLLWGRLPDGYRPARRGVVVFLGGDLFYAAAAARRLRFAAMAYTEGRAQWLRTYERFFVPDARSARRAMRMGAPADRVEVVGDLVVDAVSPHLGPLEQAASGEMAGEGESGQPGSLRVGLFAGSRAFEVRWVLPLMVQAAEIISREMGPAVRFTVVRSPFVEPGLVRETLSRSAASGAVAIEVAQEDRWQVMASCAVAVSVPGTVTAELGAMGVPTVTVLPLHKPELIPLEGLPGLLGSLPAIGPAIKRAVIRRAARHVGPISLPSRRAGEVVGPELVGEVTPAAVAAEVVGLLRDPARRRHLSRRLRHAMGPGGAAERVASRVLGRLGLVAGGGRL